MSRRGGFLLGGACVGAALILIAAIGPLSGRSWSDDQFLSLRRAAAPILASLERSRAERGCYPDSNDIELARYLPEAVKMTRSGRWVQFDTDGSVSAWLYERSDGDCLAYTLSRKLGWDPRLVYRRTGSDARWTLDPGDGGEERILEAEP